MQRTDTGAAPSLIEVLSGRRLDVLLLLALWATLLWSGTQLPQADVPFAHVDGATRADLLALRGLGLHRIAGSLPAWLLTAATLVVAVARLLPVLMLPDRMSPDRMLPDLMPERRPALPSTPDHPVGEAALAPRIQAVHDGFRAGREGSATWVLGHAAIGRGLLAAGALALLVGWLAHGQSAPAVVIETRAGGAVTAHRLEANRPGEPVAITGRCRSSESIMQCSLAAGEVTGQPVIAPGQPAAFGGQTLTWVGRAAATVATQGRLRWRRAVGEAGPAWYGFDLPDGAAVEIPALAARAALIDGRRGGPVIAATASGRALIAAAPGLVAGPATMRLDPPARLRLRLGEGVSPWWWLCGAFLAIVGVLLIGVLPAAEVRLRGGRASIVACNQATLRGRLERALQAAEEAS